MHVGGPRRINRRRLMNQRHKQVILAGRMGQHTRHTEHTLSTLSTHSAHTTHATHSICSLASSSELTAWSAAASLGGTLIEVISFPCCQTLAGSVTFHNPGVPTCHVRIRRSSSATYVRTSVGGLPACLLACLPDCFSLSALPASPYGKRMPHSIRVSTAARGKTV